ncbi:MAG: glycosyl transferase [Verrucomicrobia bacterium]|nr:MAG: glycosyl transferase [Verrucomicrobiota bacterium]
MKEMSLSSAGAQRQSAETAKASMKISIIVPVLNEGERLRPFLEHLRERAPSAEVILVNAVGSQTVSERAVALCDRVLTSGRGRAAQMNAGANAASGEVFWFVHADCQVPPGCLEEITRALQDRKVVGGCFRIRFQRRKLIYRVSDAGGNLAVELFGRCYGDHGIFCRREDFFAVGGYPNVPLLEDAEYYRLLRQRGRTRQLASKIVPSPRRYEEIGPYRLTAAFFFLSALYILRVPISTIARLYERLCVIQRE